MESSTTAPPVKDATPSAGGWFRAMRTAEARELRKANPLAYVLLSVIADRGRYHDSFNQDNLKLGEALLGDYENYGMTHKQYRTAVSQLEKWGFAAFKRTNKGTIGRLVDSRVFSIFRLPEGNQNGTPRASEGQAKGNQGATNKISKKDKNEEGRGKEALPSKPVKVFPREAATIIPGIRARIDAIRADPANQVEKFYKDEQGNQLRMKPELTKSAQAEVERLQAKIRYFTEAAADTLAQNGE